MKKIITVVSVLSFCCLAPISYACSYFPMPLLQLVELGQTSHLVSFRVSAYEDSNQEYPNYMDGLVTRQWRGEIAESSIRIYGGDGLSCQPYVTEFTLDQEWLLPVFESDGIYRIVPFTLPIAISDDTITGFISTLNCPRDSDGNANCSNLSPEQYTAVRSEQMSTTEFERALKLNTDAVAWTLKMCSGPSTRCSDVRAAFDPQTGILELPSVDVISTPFTYGVSATLQLKEGTDSTFEVINID